MSEPNDRRSRHFCYKAATAFDPFERYSFNIVPISAESRSRTGLENGPGARALTERISGSLRMVKQYP